MAIVEDFSFLTPVQQRVMLGIQGLKSNKELARELHISEHTVKEHRKNMVKACLAQGHKVSGRNGLLKLFTSRRMDNNH